MQAVVRVQVKSSNGVCVPHLYLLGKIDHMLKHENRSGMETKKHLYTMQGFGAW